MKFKLFDYFKLLKAKDDCRVSAEMHFADGIVLSGMIMKIGTGVVLFRESSAYVLVRDDQAVTVCFDGGEIDGIISRSTPDGYLVRAIEQRMAA